MANCNDDIPLSISGVFKYLITFKIRQLQCIHVKDDRSTVVGKKLTSQHLGWIICPPLPISQPDERHSMLGVQQEYHINFVSRTNNNTTRSI